VTMDSQLHAEWTTVFAFIAAVGQGFIWMVLALASARLKPLGTAIQSINEKLDDVLSRIESLTSRIDRLEVRVSEHDTHDEQHKQWVRDEFGRIRERQHELSNQVQALQARASLQS